MLNKIHFLVSYFQCEEDAGLLHGIKHNKCCRKYLINFSQIFYRIQNFEILNIPPLIYFLQLIEQSIK